MRYGDTDNEVLSYRLIDADEERFLKNYRPVCDRMGNNSIEAHKHIFGRQNHTWNGGSEGRRHYIWRLDELWILVSRDGNVSWEIPPDVTLERAWDLWDRYCDAVISKPDLVQVRRKKSAVHYGDLDHEALTYKLVNADGERWRKSFMAVHKKLHELGESTVEAHKRIFGRQDTTWVGGSENRRFYIWKMEDLWILVAKNHGVTFETAPGVSIERAWELWDKYCEAVLSVQNPPGSGAQASRPTCTPG